MIPEMHGTSDIFYFGVGVGSSKVKEVVNPFIEVGLGRCGLGRCDETYDGEYGVFNGLGILHSFEDYFPCAFSLGRCEFLVEKVI